MAELHSCYPSSPSGKRKKESKRLKHGQKGIQRKRDEIKESPPALIPPPVARRLLSLRPLPAGSYPSVHFGRELPDISSRQEVHHRFIALLHGEQLRDLHVSASACSPPSRFCHLFPEHFLLIFPSAAVAEEMFPRLGHRPALSPVVGSWQFERYPGMVVSSNSGFASLVRISSNSGGLFLEIAVTGASDFWLVVHWRCSQMKSRNLVGPVAGLPEEHRESPPFSMPWPPAAECNMITKKKKKKAPHFFA